MLANQNRQPFLFSNQYADEDLLRKADAHRADRTISDYKHTLAHTEQRGEWKTDVFYIHGLRIFYSWTLQAQYQHKQSNNPTLALDKS